MRVPAHQSSEDKRPAGPRRSRSDASLRDRANPAWHAGPSSVVCEKLGVDPGEGLSEHEAQRRLQQWGPNRLPEERGPGWLDLLRRQFAQFLIAVLVVAAALALALGERLDAAAILGIIVINAALGFAQEYRAERALASLRSLSAPTATVLRSGAFAVSPAAQVAPGDILRLEAGDIVPADARLLEVAALRLNEALLTGESIPVDKSVSPVPAEADLAERTSMVYQGGLVVNGRALAVVVATGERTEMGGIAASLQGQAPRSTPLQRRLAEMGRWLVYGAGGLCALVFIVGLLRGIDVSEMVLTSASLAVAAIPEGLPAATTIVLALAVQRMVRRNAIVRRLAAVEALGSVTVICVDKTGTLTENRMNAQELWIEGHPVVLVEGGSSLSGRSDTLTRLLIAGVLCNDASPQDGAGLVRAVGDPTEGALLDLARRFGMDAKEVRAKAPRLHELPFDAERSRMAVVSQTTSGVMAFTKGAPEVILPLAAAVLLDGREREIDDPAREDLLQAARSMAGRGMRVLAFAQRLLRSGNDEAIEEQLVLLGLVGLADPLRPDAKASIARARAAGIRTVMLTGDHPSTARAVARQLDLPAGEVVLGRQVEELTDTELDRAVAQANVFARVSSRHKLRLIESLRRLGHIIAMTGDGVNDAPALRAADVGVAMGQGGTDIARDASDIVLVDNSLHSIVAAIEDGRTIYDNIRKFVHYLVTCNLAELAVVFLVLTVDGTTPLLPLQILWVNLLTDSFPALALGLDPSEPGVMQRPPRSPAAGILGVRSLLPVIGIGALVATPALIAYTWGRTAGDVELARQFTFATLIGAHLAATFNFRSPTRPVFQLANNGWVIGAVALSIALLFAVIYVPWLQRPFRTEPFSVQEWLAIGGLSLVPLVVVEALKLLRLAPKE
ncbi:MAG: cation-transporting P-type ATPase [Dehalococcoidia bacterium]